MTARKKTATRRKSHTKNNRSKSITGEFKSFAGGLICITLLLIGMTIQGGCSTSSDDDQPTSPEENTGGSEVTAPLHYPGMRNVATNPALTEEILSHYSAMNVSFNSHAHQPNWVAWELTREKVSGDVPRAKDFLTDPRIYGCPSTSDYTRSGYDRGHMCPAADNKWSELAMKECFYMTNICPQVHEMNAGAWENLEDKCRTWAKADSAIVIVAGPILTDNLTETIGQIGVTVPHRFFKVIAAPYSKPPRGIGFIMNNGDIPGGIQACAMSIDEVEQITGHDFFASLPDDLEQQIESQSNFTQWSAVK